MTKLSNIDVHSTREIMYRYDTYLSKNEDMKEYASLILWSNGEGFTYSDCEDKYTNFTWDEWGALKKALKIIQKDSNEK